MIIVVMLAFAVFILAALAWKYDMHQREPLPMLVVAFALGAAAAYGIGNFNDWLLGTSSSTLSIAVAAGCGEEFSKLIAVVLIASFSSSFNDPMDGLIYGAFVGLGFAIFESTFYIPFTLRQMPDVSTPNLFGQESIRAVLHYLTGGIAAFGFGLAYKRIPRWQHLFCPWLAAAIAIHIVWDYKCGLSVADDHTEDIYRRGWAIGLMIVAMFLFRLAVWGANRWSPKKVVDANNDGF